MPTSGFVDQDEVAFSGSSPCCRKSPACSVGRKGVVPTHAQRNIQVIVRSRLLSEYGIDRPSAIDVDLQAVLFE